jgi:hypothetical protein
MPEKVKAIVERLKRDKILLALVVVAVLGIFAGGMFMGDDKPDAKKEAPVEKAAVQNATNSLTPTLATDFINWWLPTAMDYNETSAMQSHNQASAWMTPETAQTFQATYWTPEIAQSVTTHRLVAAFQPTIVQAQAINPDGSVVVGVGGTMVVQSNGQPMTQPFLAGFLVRQEKEGLRIAGLDARQGIMPGSTVF